jgi:predicted SAM-dependent methyltransferase
MIQVLEHFMQHDVENVVSEISRVLKPGGKYIVGVPDTVGNAQLLLDAKTPEEEDWAIRLIDGSKRNIYCYHHCSYTKRSLQELLTKHGFGDFKDLPNINFYPSIHICAKKMA